LLASQPEVQRAAILTGLTDKQAEELLWDWGFWGRPDQHPPSGNWSTWLILAGRGWGKTRTGAEWVRGEVEAGRAGRIALIAETAADARDVIVEGESGILAISPPSSRPLYEPSKRRLTWPNGAIATLFNAVEPDQLRGPQFDLAWSDELAKWRYAQETWDQLQFGLRLGRNPRQIVTTTPRPIPLVKDLIAETSTVITRGRTLDNAANLAAKFLKTITDRYGGTRLGRQELDAEILDDFPGALWTRAALDDARKDAQGQAIKAAPEMKSAWWSPLIHRGPMVTITATHRHRGRRQGH
jgi:phage terminase large subunit-like protein